MISWFKRNKSNERGLRVDMHSHLLPGLDDGSESIEESLQLLRGFQDLGYEKIITTPHIMGDHFLNTPEGIHTKLVEVNSAVTEANLSIKLECAAEYYLDDQFISMLDKKENLLTFGDNYLLVETSYMNEPMILNEVMFKILSLGLKPVLAHPERYLFFQQKPDRIIDLIDRGVLMQVNINSIMGYYSFEAKRLSKQLINKKLIHFMGSDCHNINQLQLIKKAVRTRLFQKALKLNLLNNTLL